MTSVNANVQGILADLAAKRNAGELDGYSADPNILPEFFSKSYINLTAYQRGYVYGRELRIRELEDRSDHA
jgi:hypothetical protein